MNEDGNKNHLVTINISSNSQSLNDSSLSCKSNDLMASLISLISSSLVKVIINNRDTTTTTNDADDDAKQVVIDEFYSIKIPNLSIKEYLERIVKHSKLEPSTLVMSFVLINYMINDQKYVLSLRNVYRLILASAVISIKYNEDSQFNNIHYAKIGGLTSKEFNPIEYAFFIRIGCQLKINKEQYEQTLRTLMQ